MVLDTNEKRLSPILTYKSNYSGVNKICVIIIANIYEALVITMQFTWVIVFEYYSKPMD